MERRSSLSMRNKEADVPDVSDTTLPERQEQAQKAFKEVIAIARSAVLEVDAGSEMDESKIVAMDALYRGVDDLVSNLFDAETEASRKRLKAQASWYALKLDTARIASDTRLEHKAIEVKADCAAKFDQKLRDLAQEGGSVEDGLMKRLDEQAAEITRLQRFESWLAEAREQLTQMEQDAASGKAELEKKTSDLAKLEEGNKLCQGIIARSATKELGLELQSVAKGAPLRDIVAEFATAFGDALGDVAALRQERDDLKARLEGEMEARAEDVAARAAAEAAAATAAEELSAAKKSESDALAKMASLEHVVEDLTTKLNNATGLCETLEAAVEALKERAESAETKMNDALKDTEQLKGQVAMLSGELSSAIEAREKAETAAVEAHEALKETEERAREAEDALNAQIVALRAEGAAAGDKIRSLEQRVSESEEKTEILRSQLETREAELNEAREQIGQLTKQKEELAARCAQAEKAMQEAAAEAARVVREAEAEAKKRFKGELEMMEKKVTEAAETEKGLRGRIAELELRMSRMEELEAEAARAKQLLKANEDLQAKIKQLEKRLGRMDEVEADAAHVRETLTQTESLLREAQGRLDKMRSSSNAAAELQDSLGQLEKLKKEMERSKQESKEKRAALVDSALKSLVHLSQHMAYMLAGLRLGQQTGPPMLHISSCGPSPREVNARVINGTSNSPNARRRKCWQPDVQGEAGAPPSLCESTLHAVRERTEVEVDRHVEKARAQGERIEKMRIPVSIDGRSQTNGMVRGPANDSQQDYEMSGQGKSIVSSAVENRSRSLPPIRVGGGFSLRK